MRTSCGVYALVTAHARSEKKPWLLFTCNEEVGGIGASTFCKDYRAGAFSKELDTMKLLEVSPRRICDNLHHFPYRLVQVLTVDIYSAEELNAVRTENGDWAIRSLYESEVGQYYADIPTPDELDSEHWNPSYYSRPFIAAAIIASMFFSSR